AEARADRQALEGPVAVGGEAVVGERVVDARERAGARDRALPGAVRAEGAGGTRARRAAGPQRHEVDDAADRVAARLRGAAAARDLDALEQRERHRRRIALAGLRGIEADA